ncbi:hypothetical protein [Prochlorococcus sp. MIT 1307]|uniref:hypothetical protein n=1 Tax=Prochlorococcus sp. MIT 1307 TaxID=3096219 RepID=UPI002A75DDA3|nr:hypothetical protein [Prochlorococcus sp. MIT 1307]
MIIQSCSTSPIGEELSNSFDSPLEKKSVENLNSNNQNSFSPLAASNTIKKSSNRPANSLAQEARNTGALNIQIKKQLRNEDKPAVFNPQPYRITIKLSAANPSAPAETVTKALRKAGVSFEVEMIERIDQQSLIRQSRPGRSKR